MDGGDGRITRYLWVTYDNGNSQVFSDGQTLPASTNSMTMAVTMPATLIDPPFAEDRADCPTGPIVFTEIGAGIMGSHSCFAADGSFNPSLTCMQRLFQSAGGSPRGGLYPTTDAEAAALSKGTLDDTMAFLNTQANLAIYGVDAGGAPQPFSVVRRRHRLFSESLSTTRVKDRHRPTVHIRRNAWTICGVHPAAMHRWHPAPTRLHSPTDTVGRAERQHHSTRMAV